MLKVCFQNSVLPTGAIAYWLYTNISDSRFSLSDKYILLKQDSKITQSFKIGLPIEDGWAAYINDGHMFVKEYEHKTGERYPDYCSSYETYTNDRYMEMETLSPMKVLNQGKVLSILKYGSCLRMFVCRIMKMI